MTGRVFDGEKAAEMRLVTRVSEDPVRDATRLCEGGWKKWGGV